MLGTTLEVVVVALDLEASVRFHSGSSVGSRRGGKCKVPLWK